MVFPVFRCQWFSLIPGLLFTKSHQGSGPETPFLPRSSPLPFVRRRSGDYAATSTRRSTTGPPTSGAAAPQEPGRALPVLPSSRFDPGFDSSGPECGQEENADPVFFRLSHLSGQPGRGCMDALYGTGRGQTIRLPAVILRVIVSGERQKALHRTGMHSVHAKLLSPVTCGALGFFSSVLTRKKQTKKQLKRTIK